MVEVGKDAQIDIGGAAEQPAGGAAGLGVLGHLVLGRRRRDDGLLEVGLVAVEREQLRGLSDDVEFDLVDIDILDFEIYQLHVSLVHKGDLQST